MQRLRRVADTLIALCAGLGAVALILEVVIILIDVVGRALGAPLLGSQDMITMTMIIVVFGAMALCDRNGGHVSVDILERLFSDQFNRALDVCAAILGALIFLALSWAVYESAKLSVMLNLSTNLIGLQKAWFQYALCGFAGVTALGMALRAIELAFGTRDVRRKTPISP